MSNPIIILLCAILASVGIIGLGAGISKRDPSWVVVAVLIVSVLTYNLIKETKLIC